LVVGVAAGLVAVPVDRETAGRSVALLAELSVAETPVALVVELAVDIAAVASVAELVGAAAEHCMHIDNLELTVGQSVELVPSQKSR
jgi:hypothetical protein